MKFDLTQEEIESVLSDGVYGHLACYSDGDIYLVPITYTYKDGEIISYTHEGKKIDMMRDGAVVCVQVEQLNGAKEWKSVICWGDFEEITDDEKRQEAALQLAEKFAEAREKHQNIYSPLINEISVIENKENLPVMYRINVHKMTGRQEKPE